MIVHACMHVCVHTLRVVDGSATGRKALSCCSCGRAAKSGHTSSFVVLLLLLLRGRLLSPAGKE
jgi:hypothetical protein